MFCRGFYYTLAARRSAKDRRYPGGFSLPIRQKPTNRSVLFDIRQRYTSSTKAERDQRSPAAIESGEVARGGLHCPQKYFRCHYVT